LANDTAARDHDVDKSVYVITRLAVSLLQARISEERLGVDLDFAFYCSRLARELERIADHATKIAFMTSRGQLKLSPTHIKAVAVVAEKMIPYIDNSLFLAEKLRREELHEMIDGLNAVTEDISSLSRRVAKTGRANSGLAVDSLDRLRGYLMNMAEFALERCND
jgi:phosphate uptake regulator